MGEEPPIAEADLRSLGVDLFDCLFPPRVRALYRAALAGQPAHGGLRVQVQTDSAYLAAVPWEYSYDSETGTWPALDLRTPLVRYYALPFMPSVRERKQSLRVLVVLAAPADLPELDLASERHRLEELFLPLQQAGRLTLDYTERPATVERLQNMLRAGYDMVHYVGHGTQRMGQGVLLLEKEDGKSHQVLAEEVAILLRGTGIRLVCLNACLTGAERGSLFGGLGPALVQAEIPAVVAMQYAMPDQSALRFTRAFYSAVIDREPVDAAITAGPHRAAHSTGAWQPGVGLPGLVYARDRRISVA
ncbi:MAG: CHAT domain-containing protein [Anaerolineae bacterium]